MTTVAPVEFVSSMSELLGKSENQNPTLTAMCVIQLPNTPQLQERFCMTFCGPESRALTQAMLVFYEQLADHLAQLKAGT